MPVYVEGSGKKSWLDLVNESIVLLSHCIQIDDVDGDGGWVLDLFLLDAVGDEGGNAEDDGTDVGRDDGAQAAALTALVLTVTAPALQYLVAPKRQRKRQPNRYRVTNLITDMHYKILPSPFALSHSCTPPLFSPYILRITLHQSQPPATSWDFFPLLIKSS